ncbi:MAG: UbiA family prenyltransferase [Bacteroidetes bacterium]|nr:UbiA family prenyltransferase [Bacteroidota bacterium]
MNKIFISVRPLNILMIFFSQFATVYFLGFKNELNNVFDFLHVSIYLSTIFSAAGAYILNDLTDIKSDTVNKTYKKNIIEKRTKNIFFIAYLFFTFFALAISFIASLKLGIVVFILIILLMFYNIFLKKLPLVGNILISLITAFSIFIFNLFDSNIKVDLVLIFSIYAFGINFIREIIKDAEDIEGDNIAGRFTFPILAGIKATRILLLILIFVYVLIITIYVRIMVEKYFSYPLSSVFIIYNVLCIGIPLFHLSVKAQYAWEKSDFVYMSKIAKYVMFTGILSMLFF